MITDNRKGRARSPPIHQNYVKNILYICIINIYNVNKRREQNGTSSY